MLFLKSVGGLVFGAVRPKGLNQCFGGGIYGALIWRHT